MEIDDLPPDSPLIAPIEPYIAELATSPDLPMLAVALCTLRYPASGPLLRAAVERAAEGRLVDSDDELLFFRALHIVGGRRDPLGFEPLLRFLRRPDDELERLIGDAATETLQRIAAGVFDGNTEALFDAIADVRLDEFIRSALLGAATFLTWNGRIERPAMVGFLGRFFSGKMAPPGDVAWHAWVVAVALLGLRTMQPAVLTAFDDEAIDEDFIDRRTFIDLLAEAERAPDDIGRFEREHLGYIADVAETLQRFDLGGNVEPMDELADEPDSFSPVKPVVNPWRHVGRNDPCPCGSGKKAKRCCLAA